MQIHAVTAADKKPTVAMPVAKVLAKAGIDRPATGKLDPTEVSEQLAAIGLSVEKRLEIKRELERAGII